MGRTVNAISERTSELSRVLQVVGEAVGLVIEHLDRQAGSPQDRRGGYFYWAADVSAAPLILHTQIGRVSIDSRSPLLSVENARRLVANPGHYSSGQTRDTSLEQYGGAVRGSGNLLSFSGLPEHGDEAAMLLAALKLDVLSVEAADKITDPSQNTIYFDIVSYLHQHGCWNDGNWTVPVEVPSR